MHYLYLAMACSTLVKTCIFHHLMVFAVLKFDHFSSEQGGLD